MSREIKFRAWFRPTQEYKSRYLDTYKHELESLYWHNYTQEDFLDDSWINTDDFKEIIFEQYTGLKDKNGKEIYEGDIVKYEDSVAVIIWREKNAEFGVRWLDCGVEDELDYWNTFRGPAEIIGNIHENKELLGGEE